MKNNENEIAKIKFSTLDVARTYSTCVMKKEINSSKKNNKK